MNILILNTGGIGGGRTFTYEMAKGFVENGHNVYAIIGNAKEDNEQWIDLLGNDKIYFFNNHKGFKQFLVKWVLINFDDGKAIRAKFANVRFDIVMKTIYHIWSDRMLAFIKYNRIVSVCHDPMPHSSAKKYVQILSKKFTQNSDDVIVLTKSFIPIVEKRHGISREHIFYMPHGRFTNYEVNPQKRLVTLSDDKTNFVFFGRIQKYKGIGVLLEAYKKLRKDHNDITLTIAGKGDMESYMQNIGDDQSVTIINRFIDDDEVGSLFDGENTILVLPYIDATQSGVTLIAYEYGVPIIATNTGGLKEQLNDGMLGLICEPNDAESLYKAMDYCVGNVEFAKEQKRLTAEYLHELDWDVLTDHLIRDLYGENK